MKTINFSWAGSFRSGPDDANRRFHKTRIVFATTTLGVAFFSTLYLMNPSFIVNVQMMVRDFGVESYQHWRVPVSIVVVSITTLTLIRVHGFDGEIDTVKCLEGVDQHLLKVFLIEVVISSFVGGTLGFGIGLLPSVMSGSFFIEFLLLFEPLIILRALLGNGVVLVVIHSAVATLYFAYKAVKENSAEALRHES